MTSIVSVPVERQPYIVPAAAPKSERRAVKQELRSLVRKITNNERVKKCGCLVLGQGVRIRTKEDRVYYQGLAVCGNVWLCVYCGSKVRNVRTGEVLTALCKSIELNNTNLFATWTLAHYKFHRLEDSLAALKECKAYVRRQKDVRAFYKKHGFIGDIVATEITQTPGNGWHPHLHVIMVLAFPVPMDEQDRLQQMIFRHAARFYERKGFGKLSADRGFQIEEITRDYKKVGKYLTKMQGGALPQYEMTRADLKKGCFGSRTPFEIAADIGNIGLCDDIALWHEYEAATKKRKSISWSPGLRAALLGFDDEKTDEQIANENVDGQDLIYIEKAVYKRFVELGIEMKVLHAVERGGWLGFIDILQQYELEHLGGFYKIDESSGLENTE